MSGLIEGTCRTQATLFPERLDDYLTEENDIRVIDAFIDSLVLSDLDFKTVPAETGRPGYHPSTMLKLFVYGYLNRIQSTRRLEREAGRNVELMWLLGRLAPDFKTIADFRKDNGKGIKNICRAFIGLCRQFNSSTSWPDGNSVEIDLLHKKFAQSCPILPQCHNKSSKCFSTLYSLCVD